MTISTARSRREIEALADAWRQVEWPTERAELEYFLAETERPLALLRGDAALVGGVAEQRLESRLGYLRVYAPRLRVLRAVGVAGDAAELARVALREVDAITVPALPLASVAYRSLEPLARQRFVPSWQRQLLRLPQSFDAFLASRTKKIRSGVRYDARKLETALGDGLRVEVHRSWSPEIVDDVDSVARTTYQRRLGAGFSAEKSAVIRVALEHGWARVFLLYDGDRPIAFWLCGIQHDTIRLNTTGYLPAYAQYRPGIYLLMRVIEDSIADPALRVLDFGPGRSDYKRHFSNDAYEERNLVLFAPTLRAQRVRYARTAIAGATLCARRTLDAVGGTQRLKTTWRRRLRR